MISASASGEFCGSRNRPGAGLRNRIIFREGHRTRRAGTRKNRNSTQDVGSIGQNNLMRTYVQGHGGRSDHPCCGLGEVGVFCNGHGRGGVRIIDREWAEDIGCVGKGNGGVGIEFCGSIGRPSAPCTRRLGDTGGIDTADGYIARACVCTCLCDGQVAELVIVAVKIDRFAVGRNQGHGGCGTAARFEIPEVALCNCGILCDLHRRGNDGGILVIGDILLGRDGEVAEHIARLGQRDRVIKGIQGDGRGSHRPSGGLCDIGALGNRHGRRVRTAAGADDRNVANHVQIVAEGNGVAACIEGCGTCGVPGL